MATNLQNYQVSQPLEKAERKAFKFVRKEDAFTRKSAFRKKQIEKVGGLSAFWIILFPIAICLALVFGLYESKMAESAIATFLDPIGEGMVNPTVIKLFGIGLALYAMIMGHLLSESIKGEVNEITGRTTREFGAKFYLSLVGLIAYVAFQYYMVQAAGQGGKDFRSFAIVAIGVALFEILVGVLVLGKAITYLLIFLLTINIGLLSIGMTKTSRETNEYYRDYRAVRDTWNLSHPAQQQVLEGNDNIRRAIAYYSGIRLTPDTNRTEEEATIPANSPTAQTSSPTQNDRANNTTQRAPKPDGKAATEEEIEGFVNDDSDNLTL